MRAIRLGLSLWLLMNAIGASADEFVLSSSKLNQIALRFERGLGREQDYAKAYRLYCLAAAFDSRRAKYQLGWLYFNGRGVARDHGTALGWFRRAAVQGDRYALRMVKKFPRIRPKHDSSCPLTRNPKKMTRQMIHAWANILGTELGVDPRFVLAVIKTESNFNPSALSPKLAYGLMQLMPDTAKRFAVNRLHPVENMIGGVLYLRSLLRHFHGNVRLTLAAYNAGENAVRRYRGIPPYQETRQYVRRILADYRKPRHPVPKALLF